MSAIQQQAYVENFCQLATTQWSGQFGLRSARRMRDRPERVRVSVRALPVQVGAPSDFTVQVVAPPPDARDNVYAPSTLTSSSPLATIYERDVDEEQAVPDDLRILDFSPGPVRARRVLRFEPGSDRLTPEDLVRLNDIRADRRETVRVAAYPSPDAGRDAPLLLSRAIRVRNVIIGTSQGAAILVVPMNSDPEPAAGAGRVEVTVSRRRPRIAVHELGHMLGLDDEYAAAPGRSARHQYGQPVGHSALATRIRSAPAAAVRTSGSRPSGIALGPVRAGDDESSVMHAGAEIRSRHYVTFVEALAQLTATAPEDWQIEE